MSIGADRAFNYVSLFSGCGGFDLGATSIGGNCVVAADIDPSCVNTFNRNFGPLARVHDLALAPPAATKKAKVDVVIAGPPCQGFSVLGHQEYSDHRNGLLLAAARSALHYAPAVVVIENVLGVLSPRYKRVVDELGQVTNSV